MQTQSPYTAGLLDSSIVRLWANELDSIRAANPNFILVDVRTEAEFRESHIWHAVNADVFGPDFAGRIGKLSRTAQIGVYDIDGIRSAKAAEEMRRLGFQRVYELAGGLFHWQTAGKVLVDGKLDTSQVLK